MTKSALNHPAVSRRMEIESRFVGAWNIPKAFEEQQLSMVADEVSGPNSTLGASLTRLPKAPQSAGRPADGVPL